MSADRWRECPICKIDVDTEIARILADAKGMYGKVSLDEYLEAQKQYDGESPTHESRGLGDWYAESAANARLISGAPDLLLALQGIVSTAELFGTNGEEFFDARNEALRAIAKAEGRE